MSAKILTPSSSQERGLQTSEGVVQALGIFLAIQNSTLSWVLRVLTFAVLLLATGALEADDPMFSSGLVAAALSLFSFRSLMQRIPVYFWGSLEPEDHC